MSGYRHELWALADAEGESPPQYRWMVWRCTMGEALWFETEAEARERLEELRADMQQAALEEGLRTQEPAPQATPEEVSP